MKIYIASKVVHAPKWLQLRAEGAPFISTWIDEAGEGQSTDYSELAQRCLSEVHGCDALILYCEPGEILKGAIIEAGAALALGIPVHCVGDSPSLSRVFERSPLWTKQVSVRNAITALHPGGYAEMMEAMEP